VLKEFKQEILLHLTTERDVCLLEALVYSDLYEGKNCELVKHFLERFRRGDVQALEPLLAYLEQSEVQSILWATNDFNA
jgi:hypothetical protein